MTQFEERLWGILQTDKEVTPVTPKDLLRSSFFIFKSYMMQRQRKQDKASPIKIQYESFGEKAGKIKQHLKNLLV